jgi:hypothetical protein
MSKADEYQWDFEQIDKVYDARPEDIVDSLKFLIEDMIQTIKELEEAASKESQAKRIKQEASARTGIKVEE